MLRGFECHLIAWRTCCSNVSRRGRLGCLSPTFGIKSSSAIHSLPVRSRSGMRMVRLIWRFVWWTAPAWCAAKMDIRSSRSKIRLSALPALGALVGRRRVAAKGMASIDRLIVTIRDNDDTSIPDAARMALKEMAEQIEALTARVERLDRTIIAGVKGDEETRRLTSVPGVGPIIAATVKAVVQDAAGFRTGRDFASWIGLTPRSHSNGGKERLGAISKRGNKQLRTLLVVGATSILKLGKRGFPLPQWIAALMARRPFKVVAVALANKIARTISAQHQAGIANLHRAADRSNAARRIVFDWKKSVAIRTDAPREGVCLCLLVTTAVCRVAMIFLPSSIDRPRSPSRRRSSLLSIRTSRRLVSPNSFVPSIEIIHSIAINISATKEMVMAQSALTNRGNTHPREVTGLEVSMHGVAQLSAGRHRSQRVNSSQRLAPSINTASGEMWSGLGASQVLREIASSHCKRGGNCLRWTRLCDCLTPGGPRFWV